MSMQQSSTTSSTRPSSVTDNRLGPARTAILASSLALGASAVAAVLVVNPWPARDKFDYVDVASVRDGMWTGILIDALGLAVVGISLSLIVCALARSRGAVWANVGAVVAILGGLTFAMGAFGFAAVAWYATNTAAVPATVGTQFLEYTVDNPDHVMGPQMAGFLLFTVGLVLLSVALLRAASVPPWLPVGLLVLTVAQFIPVPGRALDFVQVALMALLVAVAWQFHRVESTQR